MTLLLRVWANRPHLWRYSSEMQICSDLRMHPLNQDRTVPQVLLHCEPWPNRSPSFITLRTVTEPFPKFYYTANRDRTVPQVLLHYEPWPNRSLSFITLQTVTEPFPKYFYTAKRYRDCPPRIITLQVSNPARSKYRITPIRSPEYHTDYHK